MQHRNRAGIAGLTALVAWTGLAQPAEAARLPVTSTKALRVVQEDVPGVSTSVRKVRRDGFLAWAVTITRSDGSVVVGYVDRRSGIVFDWTVQAAPNEPVLDLDGADKSRTPATPPPAVGEPLPSTAEVDQHRQPVAPTAPAAAATTPAPAPSEPTPAPSADHDSDDHAAEPADHASEAPHPEPTSSPHAEHSSDHQDSTPEASDDSHSGDDHHDDDRDGADGDDH